MKRNYYAILSQGILMFNTSLEVKLVHKTFDLITYPRHWFFVETLSSSLLRYLQLLSIPFIAIKDNEGTWFLDLAYGFNQFTKEVGSINSDFYEETIDDISFAYNYPIFGLFGIKQISKLQTLISLDDVKSICRKLKHDLIIMLKSIEIPFREPILTFYIYPKSFVLKGLYLNHYVERNTPKLTLRFVTEVSELIAKFSKELNMNLKFQGAKLIKTKKNFLDVFEKQLLEQLSTKGFGQVYLPNFNIPDDNVRLVKIKREVGKAIEKIKKTQ